METPGGRRARKADEARWTAAKELAARGPELGYQLRLELGGLAPEELERLFVRITDTVATAGYIDRDMLTQWVAFTRRETAEAPDA